MSQRLNFSLRVGPEAAEEGWDFAGDAAQAGVAFPKLNIESSGWFSGIQHFLD